MERTTLRHLEDFIQYANQIAEKQNLAILKQQATRFPERSLGVTMGQILWKNPKDKLEMLPCWLEIKVARPDYNEPYQVAFAPLISKNIQKPISLNKDVYLSPQLLHTLIDSYRVFGGETIGFKSNSQPKFNLSKRLEPQIDAYMLTRILARHHDVCSSNGDMVLVGKEILGLGQASHASINQHNCHLRKYEQFNIAILNNQQIQAYGGRRKLSSSRSTYRTTIVPTIWICNEQDYDCFLDFRTNWRSVHDNNRITGKVGDFIVSHNLNHQNKLITATSLRITASNSKS